MIIISYIKKRLIFASLTALLLIFMSTASFSMNESKLINQLDGLDAQQALALANQWHWEKQPVKTHITTKEVVFQFESGTTKTIALPKEKVMIAVAPFINKTHE